MSVNCQNLDGRLVTGRGRCERNGLPGASLEDAKEGEVQARELERQKLGGEARAEEWTSGPRWREALSVIRVEVSEEVSLASLRPSIDGD